MKKFLAIVLTFILCFGVLSLAHAEDTAEVPEGYTPIYTAEDLYNIRNALAGKYILMNDIDLSVYENWEPIGTPDAPFTGELNGNGFLIRNLKINVVTEKSENYYGLFGVATGCFFKSVIVENGFISVTTDNDTKLSETNIFAGMIVAKTSEENYTRIVKCAASGKIDVIGGSNVFVGGLLGVGIADNCILSSSNYTDININTENYTQNIIVGGLLGGSSENKESYSESYFRIEKSANYGNIILNNEVCSENTQFVVGGISGFQISGNELSECYNRGNISSVKPSGKFLVGGILGEAIWRLEKGYNTGKINVVTDENDTVSAICFIKEPYLSFPEEPVMPADFTVYNCYCLNSDYVPCTQNSDDTFDYYKNVFVLTEEEFKNQESFVGFDFESVWEMEENGYPVLKSQPLIIVKEFVELEEGNIYPIKRGKTNNSTNNSVAIINKNGEISAISAGSAVITVDYEYNYKTEYNVNITEKSVSSISPPTESPLENCWIVRLFKWLFNIISTFFNSIFSIIIYFF